MGDYPGHPHPGPISHRPEVHRGGHPASSQMFPQEAGRMAVRRDPGGPQVGPGLGGLVHGGKGRWGCAGDHPREAVRPGGCQCTRCPQGLPSVGIEAAEGPCRGQRLHDRAARIDAALEIFDGLVGSTRCDGLG